MKLTLKWSLLVAIACLCGTTNLAARSETADNGIYTTNDLEFYLTEEDIFFIRPGLVIEILEVTVPADMQPEVTYTISDPRGMPLDHEGVTTPGVVDMRFTLSNIPMGEEQKVRLAYERISRNGVLTMLAPGEYHYKFDVVIESGQDTTHTIVLGGRRDLREFDLERYADNDVESWVPDGTNDAVPRDIVTAPTCNRCHQELRIHGRWESPQACTQCHNPTRNTRFDTLIHAVHSAGEAGGHDFEGYEYPAEIKDCQVCHTGGTPTDAFPLVATPNATAVCDATGNGTTLLEWGDLDAFEIRMDAADGKLFADKSGPAGSQETGKWVKDGTVFYLVDKASGDTIQKLTVNTTALGCVSNAPGLAWGEAGSQHTNWMDHPSRAVCTSCHNHADVNFETGENHSEFEIVVPDDETCGNCHEPDSGKEYDRSVAGAHQMLYKSAQLPGVIVEFKEVTNTNPGDAPIVTYSVKSKKGALIPAELNRLRFVITGPNEDYSFYAREDVRSGSVEMGNDWVYTFNTPLPMDAEGSFTIGLEGRATVAVDLGGEVSDQRDVAEPPRLAFAVTDATAVPRRMIVDDAKCESCHVNLALHGGGRRDANYCITCHRPDLVDIATPSESVHMKWMIHKIHRGEELQNGYVVVRNRGTYDFSDKVFPGDLRNCDACHVNDSEQLPLPEGVLPTITEQAWWSPTLPQAAACLSCHDDDESAVHAYSNTTFFGESCGTCHGPGKFAAVDRVHAH